METFCHAAVADAVLEIRARHAALESDVKLSTRNRIRDEPHLGLGITAQLRCLGCGRMDLQRKLLLRIEQLNQQREAAGLELRIPEQVGAMILDEPMQILAR